MYDNTSRVIEVDINEILPNRFQPRIQFDEEEILELSDSIKEHGVIQPIVVRTIGDKYEIIAGERRYKASVLAGKETVPVIVKNLNDKDSAEIALIENVQRKNLTPIEEALSYKKILDMGYITQENLASKLGKSQSAVANKIRLLNLSDEVQEALLENKISERHARSLLKLTTSKQQNEMLNRIISERLTVRKTDEEIEKLKNNPSEEGTDGEEKIIEKGEIDMNNNMFGMPNIPESTQSNFDIFKSSTSEQPVVNTIQEPQSAPTLNEISTSQPQTSFDIFGMSQPVVNTAPELPSIPSTPVPAPVEMPSMPIFNMETPTMNVQPEMPSMPAPMEMPTFNVEAPTMNVQPEIPSMPASMEMPTFNVEAPTMSAQPEMPSMPAPMEMPTFNVETPTMNVQPEMSSMPASMEMPTFNVEAPTMSAQPEIPSMPTPEVPLTAPIIESPANNNAQMTQQSENLFSFGQMNEVSVEPKIETPQQEPVAVPEFKMPEPIIITDYSKQYDPIMPQTPQNVTPTVDFKEVINTIRDCSKKIEQYGFKIDVEEYDLANLYQVIFKIEK